MVVASANSSSLWGIKIQVPYRKYRSSPQLSFGRGAGGKVVVALAPARNDGDVARKGSAAAIASSTTTALHTAMSRTKTATSSSSFLPPPVTTWTTANKSNIIDGHVDGDKLKLDFRSDFASEPAGGGVLVENGLVYRERVLVKSFEIGPDWKLTMGSLMKYFQDTALSHTACMGIVAEGFGWTPYMRSNNLCWVVTATHVVVNRYPSWGEVFQLDNWLYASGKNGLGNDWLIRDGKTGQVLVRATNCCVMMNKKTRRLSRFVQEVRDEFAPHFLTVSDSVAPRDKRKIQRITIESADNVRTGLSPGWNDLDINYHVSNVKYIDWIIEGAPRWILESRELCGMTLEYKKECRIDDGGIQSLSKMVGNSLEGDGVELEHSLCMEDGSEIMRARTSWRIKSNVRAPAPARCRTM
ncbi:unnamed protein product [Linum trigynum]|uniref:Acyl-[acyl-carrier-protein] hydrolase n=1 Tax=Linum trigynum TaxID=586398 RepID=A0AAV2FPG6_9ROSI